MPRAFCLIRAARLAYLQQHYGHQPLPEIAASLALSPAQAQALAATLNLPRRQYRSFTMQQVAYLRQYYTEQPPTHFAELWGVSVWQVYRLAARHGITRRAPNGRPAWRSKRESAWPAESKWAA